MARALVLQLESTSGSPGGFIKTLSAGPHGPGDSDSAGLAGLRTYISKKRPCATHAVLPGTTVWRTPGLAQQY